MSRWGVTPSVLRTTTKVALGGDVAIITVPDNYEAARGTGLVIWLHGSGGNEFTPYGDTAIERTMSDALLANGLIIASPYGHSNTNWGNNQAITDANALYDYVIANWNITDTMFLGQSMGGMHGLLLYANGHIPAIGWHGVSPVCSLQAMYGTAPGTTSFSTAIEVAYGMASDGSDYAAKSSGHDPLLLAASTWDNKMLRFTVSNADTVVARANHTDPMVTLVTGHATECAVVTGTGGHLSLDQFRPADFLAFRERCLAA